MEEVITQIRHHIQSPLLPMPNVQQGRRRKLFIPEIERRRSARLDTKSKGRPGSYVKRAWHVLMARMGIYEIEGEPSVDCMMRYAKFFAEPLTPSRIEALAKLFFLEAPLPEDLVIS